MPAHNASISGPILPGPDDSPCDVRWPASSAECTVASSSRAAAAGFVRKNAGSRECTKARREPRNQRLERQRPMPLYPPWRGRWPGRRARGAASASCGQADPRCAERPYRRTAARRPPCECHPRHQATPLIAHHGHSHVLQDPAFRSTPVGIDPLLHSAHLGAQPIADAGRELARGPVASPYSPGATGILTGRASTRRCRSWMLPRLAGTGEGSRAVAGPRFGRPAAGFPNGFESLR